jgi:hypothetical protein
MNLKFIGEDGSMGLKHGEVYDTSIVCTFHDNYITVKWLDHDGVFRKCPYSSPAAFTANWAKPGQKVAVRKKEAKKEAEDPVKHGKWIRVELGKADPDQFWICSECHEHDFIKSYYCPHCGAIMDGGKDGAG